MKLNNFILSSVTTSLICFTNVSFGNAFNGFYIGGEVGGTSTMATQNRFVETSNLVGFVGEGPATLSILQNSWNGPKSLKAANSFKGALYAGWGDTINQIYLGGEVFVDWAKYKNHDDLQVVFDTQPIDLSNNLNSATRLSKVQFGGDFRLGYLITLNTMLYGRVGGAYAQRTVEIADIIHQTNFNPIGGLLTDVTFNLSGENEAHRIALRLGGGLETQICPNVNIRMDYIYTYYGHVSVEDFGIMQNLIFDEEFFSDISANSSVTTRIYNNTVMLGLTYLL